MTAPAPLAGFDPAVEPPSGADLLDELAGVLARYVVLPSPEALDAVVLWITATHGQPTWTHAPRLVVKSPLKRCGKSRLLDVVEATSHAATMTMNATVAAIFRSIDPADPPTLLMDEAERSGPSRRPATARKTYGH